MLYNKITSEKNYRRNMKQEILDKIKVLKNKYEPEGFLIIGIFGSVARGEASKKSDIDL